MTDMSDVMEMPGHSPGVALRSLVIGLTAFLTVVDLFATQAILPSLTRHYNVTPAAMGFAVNASTIGMAVDVNHSYILVFLGKSTNIWKCNRVVATKHYGDSINI